MKASFTHATYVSALNEGISKNVHYLKENLREAGVDGVLRTPTVRVEELNSKLHYITKGAAAARCLRESLKDPTVDVVHYHVAIPLMGVWGSVARLAARKTKPLVGHLWNPIFVKSETAIPPSPVELAYHRVFNSGLTLRAGVAGFDALIVSSRYQEQQLRKAGYTRPIHVIPNGVALDEYRPPADEQEKRDARDSLGIPQEKTVVAYFGHLTPWKGVRTLVSAMPEVAAANPEAHFVIAHTGYGKEGEAIHDQLAKGGLTDRVTFLGNLHVPTFLKAVDVGVVPAMSPVGTACFPNVLLEFHAAGIPVVASRVGSIPEVVQEGRTGHLAPPGDAKAVAAALNSLLADPASLRQMGRQARRLAVERFDWLGIAKEVRGVYEGLLAERAA
ncbi:MAG TPA: glycosyltransferase [Candidatus Thermoplasmatota archaeon]|nr:glycosyltransferase [Candidatus Thermoplasmatota archaeon]